MKPTIPVRGIHGILKPLMAAALVAALALNARFALADAPPTGCPVATPEQARSLADVLIAQGEYQRAAQCYEAGGDYARADRAYLAAVRPEGTATAHRVSDQAQDAKALLRQVRLAFSAGH